jgi:sporulation protein YunB
MQNDCCRKYKIKKKGMKTKTKFKIALCVILALFALFVFYYIKVICPIIVTLSEERIRSLSTRVMSDSVAEVLVSDNVTYDEIVKITYDNNEIKAIETNSVKINIIIRKITEMVQSRLDGLIVEGIDVALGTFTGIPFLFGIGPQVPIQLVPIGTINTKITSNFVSAGINQTLHKIYFDITANIGMVLPALSSNFVTNLDVVLAESVIVGKVPEVYLNGGLITSNG